MGILQLENVRRSIQIFKMYYTIYGIGITIQIFQMFIFIQCQCPEYFRYFRNETTEEIMGTVEIPSPPRGVPLHLHVILNVATILPTKYVGRIELTKSKEESIRSILQGSSLFYQIYFPVRNPIPVVTSITLNNVQYCTGPPAIGVVITKIILEHSLYPPRVIIPLTEQLLNFISNHTTSTSVSSSESSVNRHTTIISGEKETTTTTTTSDFQFARPSKHRPDDSSCGLTGGSPINPLIANGEPTSPIMWPWIAAIFRMKSELEFQCTGNLISRQHVLTVAHCLAYNDENLTQNFMLVSLGRFNLHDWEESGSRSLDVAEYKIHPEYKNPENGDSDLAVIKLTERIEYTPRIRPICLWMGEIDLDSVVGKSGYVVGWGSDGTSNNHSSKPRMSKVPIVSQEDCLRSNDGFIEVTSRRTFCAGRRDGTGPCNGDSGSGLAMYHTRYGRYHLRGIVSLSMIDARSRLCDLKEYIVYVDIAKYLPWIQQEMIS